MTERSKAQRLAEELVKYHGEYPTCTEAAAELRRLHAENEAKDALLRQAMEALKQAKYAVSAWGLYANEYFQQKHDLQGDIDAIQAQITALRSALAEQPAEQQSCGCTDYNAEACADGAREPKPGCLIGRAEQPAEQESEASEHAAMLKDFQAEVVNCYELANRLDAFNPEENKAFTGTPSERIERQLRAHRVPGFSEDVNV